MLRATPIRFTLALVSRREELMIFTRYEDKNWRENETDIGFFYVAARTFWKSSTLHAALKIGDFVSVY